MTDIDDRVDLDEYSRLLSELEIEVREYGKQRKSLQDVVRALRALDKSSAKAIHRIEEAAGSGEQVYTSLKELALPDQITEVQEQYRSHQRSLDELSSNMKGIVQEQQRASLEALQSARHARDSLERYVQEVQSLAEAQEKRLGSLAEQMSVVLDELGSVSSLAREMKGMLVGTRLVAIFTLIVLIAFALVSFFA
jgi:chromosome segregation ATPase